MNGVRPHPDDYRPWAWRSLCFSCDWCILCWWGQQEPPTDTPFRQSRVRNTIIQEEKVGIRV